VTTGVTTVVDVLKGVIALEENVADGGVAVGDGEEDAGEVVVWDPEVRQRGLPLLSLEQVSPVASNTQQRIRLVSFRVAYILENYIRQQKFSPLQGE